MPMVIISLMIKQVGGWNERLFFSGLFRVITYKIRPLSCRQWAENFGQDGLYDVELLMHNNDRPYRDTMAPPMQHQGRKPPPLINVS